MLYCVQTKDCCYICDKDDAILLCNTTRISFARNMRNAEGQMFAKFQNGCKVYCLNKIDIIANEIDFDDQVFPNMKPIANIHNSRHSELMKRLHAEGRYTNAFGRQNQCDKMSQCDNAIEDTK